MKDRNLKLKDILENFNAFPSNDIRDLFSIEKFKNISKYSYISNEGKIYDIRNDLNNLSGKEWLYFLNSVEITNYPTSGKESYCHSLRRIHPTPKPPQLMRSFIEFFTKEGGWVLDPFMGVGGVLLGASLCRRNAVGLDICREYIDTYIEVNNKLDLKEQIAICEDARNATEIFSGKSEFFDLILTDPPYCNMQSKLKTGEKAKKNGKSFATPFTNDKRDIGNVDYKTYLEELKEIIKNLIPYLKNKKYLVLFTKDLQPTKDHFNMLHSDIVIKLSEIKDLQFRGYKVWFDKSQNLYPFGYPFSYVSNQFHQFILIFRKEYRK